jgi:2-polyprenyl-3-methyl-5-hydroxy-6-metoxy-1,4-benzoquinol methylase
MTARNIDNIDYAELYRYIDKNILIKVWQLFKYKFIFKIFRYVGTNDSILDIGCGTGAFLKNLRCYGYTNLTGMDVDDKAFRDGSVEYIDFIKESIVTYVIMGKKRYENVFVQSMLHHLEEKDYERSVTNIADIVNDGGRLFIYEPNIKSLFGRIFYHFFLRIFPKIYAENKREEFEHLLLCKKWCCIIQILQKRGLKCLHSSDWSFYYAYIFIKE